jgi:hypothetical protein
MQQGNIISTHDIEQKIYLARGIKVMFDIDLAQLYGVETKTLNRAVKRNSVNFRTILCFSSQKRNLKT